MDGELRDTLDIVLYRIEDADFRDSADILEKQYRKKLRESPAEECRRINEEYHQAMNKLIDKYKEENVVRWVPTS